ncbi:MAG: DUF4864 domain-containing protein [Myxococcota bacterium]|nr:DUF4864 domain-containing protein [Myxococcota bacterium]
MVDLSLSDQTRICNVITDQLKALSRLDGDAAWSVLTPQKQRQGSGAEFLRSLALAFPQLVQAAKMQFGSVRPHDVGFAQHVRVYAHDQTHVDAVYLLRRQEDGSFLIEGCILRPHAQQEENSLMS